MYTWSKVKKVENRTSWVVLLGCSSLLLRPSARRRINHTSLCDACPVRRQTFGYLPSRMTSLPYTAGSNLYCLVTEATHGHSSRNALFPHVFAQSTKRLSEQQVMLPQEYNRSDQPSSHVEYSHHDRTQHTLAPKIPSLLALLRWGKRFQ